jgi:alpha-L-rhamnosidase
MKITHCKTNHLVNPLGFSMTKPVFSYIVEEATGKTQSVARIIVSVNADMSEPVFDSGFTSEMDSLAYSADIVLKPHTRYYWTVSVKTNAGEETTGEINWFETAKMDEPWQAEWITCDSSNVRHPVFSKQIEQPDIKEARLYICGLGLYEAYINGEKVSDEFLTPYCNNYEKWLQYQTYDVTEQLRNGGNLEVLLGNGWYKGRYSFDPRINSKPYYGTTWKLIAELHITHSDGSCEVVCTDESWGVSRSKITASSIYDGEYFDAALPDVKLVAASLCEETLPPLQARFSTPVRIRKELPAAEVIHTPLGETVVDLGQNMAGIFRLRVNEPKGTTIRLLFGEVLQGGNFYNGNLRTAKAEYVYVSDGQEREIVPHFTFYGFRYVKIEGVKDLRKEDFTGLVFHSEIPKTGTLLTGSKLVNRLIQNVEWGQRGNFIDIPTDCPQRDERMGFTGDAQVFCATAAYQTDCLAFFRKYFFDLITEQQDLDGAVPNVIPSVGIHDFCAAWADAACIIPWTMYLFYGDKTILAEQFASMRAWVDYVTKVDGENHGWRYTIQNGDWLALDNVIDGTAVAVGATDTGFIASVYYAISANLVSKAAAALGNTTDAEKYQALHRQIVQDVRDEYFSKNGRCCINTQTALVMTLYYHLLDDNERIKDELVKKFKSNGNKLQTGFLGTPILCNCLSENNMSDLAYDLLLNEEYPGWLYEVNLGATTVWERWNSLLPDGSISSTGMNSLNHYAFGSIVEWMYRYCAGIQPLEEYPGFRKIQLKPEPNYQLKHLEAEYESAAGTYKSAWKVIDETHVELWFTVPFNCSAELFLPYSPDKMPKVLTPGEYHFNYETTKPLRTIFSTNNTIAELLGNPKSKAVLASVLPDAEQTPLKMQAHPFRRLFEQFGHPNAKAILEELDAKLSAIGAWDANTP